MINTLTYQCIPAETSVSLPPPQLVNLGSAMQTIEGICQALRLVGVIDLSTESQVADFHYWLVRNQYCVPLEAPTLETLSTYEVKELGNHCFEISAELYSLRDFSRFALSVLTKATPDD